MDIIVDSAGLAWSVEKGTWPFGFYRSKHDLFGPEPASCLNPVFSHFSGRFLALFSAFHLPWTERSHHRRQTPAKDRRHDVSLQAAKVNMVCARTFARPIKRALRSPPTVSLDRIENSVWIRLARSRRSRAIEGRPRREYSAWKSSFMLTRMASTSTCNLRKNIHRSLQGAAGNSGIAWLASRFGKSWRQRVAICPEMRNCCSSSSFRITGSAQYAMADAYKLGRSRKSASSEDKYFLLSFPFTSIWRNSSMDAMVNSIKAYRSLSGSDDADSASRNKGNNLALALVTAQSCARSSRCKPNRSERFISACGMLYRCKCRSAGVSKLFMIFQGRVNMHVWRVQRKVVAGSYCSRESVCNAEQKKPRPFRGAVFADANNDQFDSSICVITPVAIAAST